MLDHISFLEENGNEIKINTRAVSEYSRCSASPPFSAWVRLPQRMLVHSGRLQALAQFHDNDPKAFGQPSVSAAGGRGWSTKFARSARTRLSRRRS